MILKSTLAEVVESQKENLLKSSQGILRDKLKEIKLSKKYATVITGIRRSGKSTLLRQLLTKQKKFSYLNFEDIRLFNFTLNDFKKLEEVFLDKTNPDVYFFDEIQNVSNWERYIRTLVDENKTIVITGSNASLLSNELGTRLTGRHLRYELYPFSYLEYLKKFKVKSSANSFEDYIKYGGFPEYLNQKNENILQELVNDILSRDIVARYSLRNPKMVKEIALYLLSNVGKEFSYQNLRKMYNLGSVNTVISLVGYFENSYLLFTIPQFDFSYKKQLINSKKVYAIDTGLVEANSVSFSKDKGRVLENAVFIYLKRSGKEVFFYKKKNECDFISRDRKQDLDAYQVCYNLTDENKDREINGIVDALTFIKKNSGLILTLNQTDEFIVNGKKIIVKPVWKWMTEYS